MKQSRDAIDVSPGTVARHCTEAEAADLAERWLAVYGAHRQGVNWKAYLWHVFSTDRHPNAGGKDAWAQYRREDAIEFVVLCNDRRQAFITDAKPDECPWPDCCIFPPNLAWTMARTHEEGWLGPYFARHPKHQELDAANAAALHKRRAATEARAKG